MSNRIALCHEWTTVYGGSEQVAGRLAEVLDVRDVFTFAAEPTLVARIFPGRRVQAHRLGRGALTRQWRWLLPLMPGAWSRLDLSAFDVVVTSAHACANAIRVRPDAVHVSYCHTPMRYAWDWRMELGRLPAVLRPLWPAAAAALRRADRAWAQRVTAFIANSQHVARRIRTSYGRDATVVHPPIDTQFWSPASGVPREDFYLFVGRLVPYKRADQAVRAARMAGVNLVVAGDGPELEHLRGVAGPSVRFVVRPDRATVRDLYRGCRALVTPGVEDFGMTMAEAQACGAPVIARGQGGAREIVVDGRTGVLYEGAGPESLGVILRDFEPGPFDPAEARANAERFVPERFDEGVMRVITEAVDGRRSLERETLKEAAWGHEVKAAAAPLAPTRHLATARGRT